MKVVKLQTKKRKEIIDVTNEIEKKIEIHNGIALIYVPHTTAGIFINEGYDDMLKQDFIKYSNAMPKINFLHAEGNGDAHVYSSFIGNNVTVIIENSRIKLGTWQRIMFFELDGPRSREIWIKEIESK